MMCEPDPEPDERGPIITVGQDKAGHWLTQTSGGLSEGRFVSRGAALSFARAQCEIHHATLRIAATPLVPFVSFAPVAANERALPHAA